MNTRPFRWAVPLAAALALTACNNDDKNLPPVETPPPPTLGAQIDRMARPAVNTALDHTFDLDADRKGMSKDAYNANASPTDWVAAYTNEVRANLAILDSLDSVCGNQLFADATAPRYGTLAAVLADDRLYLNTGSTTCTTYLAVEANATGIIPNGDCGGRTPLYDVIDTTYSVVALGAVSGFGDTIDRDGDSTPSLSAFPFLGAPVATP
ncbi:MAG: DUF4331 family protein [bacterium]